MDVNPGNGIVMVNGNVPSSYPFTYTFDKGTKVNIEAVRTTGYRFKNWSGDLSGTTNPTIIIISCNKSITANFSFNWYVVISILGSIVLAGFFLIIYILRQT